MNKVHKIDLQRIWKDNASLLSQDLNYIKHHRENTEELKQSYHLHLPKVRTEVGTEVGRRIFYYHESTVFNNFCYST